MAWSSWMLYQFKCYKALWTLMNKQVSTYSAVPLYKAEIHAVNYNMKYLCEEVIFCTLFIMKGMATWSTVLPGKKQPCKESDNSYHIYHILQSYTTINLKIQELIHQNTMWSCFRRCHWWNGMTRIQSFNTRYSRVENLKETYSSTNHANWHQCPFPHVGP